jgi:hypothetical protein
VALLAGGADGRTPELVVEIVVGPDVDGDAVFPVRYDLGTVGAGVHLFVMGAVAGRCVAATTP